MKWSSLSGRRVLRTLGVVLFWGVVTGAIVYGIGHLSFDQTFSWTTLLFSIGIGTVYVIIMGSFMHATGRLVDRFVPLRSKRAVLIHTASQSLSMLVSFIAATALLKLLLGRYLRIGWTSILIVALVAFSAALIGHSFSYMQRFHRRMREAERAQHAAEMNALRAQINPHFLFNALNSITALIRTRPAEAETVTEDLADLFRYSLRASKHNTVPLAEEIEAVRLYLAIEQARFRDRLQFEISVPDDLHAARVPSMTLQPLAENAVKHGVGQTHASCTVTVHARSEDGTLCLRVTDTGPGFDTTDPAVILARGTGLANVRDRLSTLFGSEATFSIRPQGVELTMPLQTTDDDEPSSFARTDSHPPLRHRTNVSD